MHRKILVVICGLILVAGVLLGVSQAEEGMSSLPAMRIAGQADSVGPAQIRFITPTPTPSNDDVITPMRSEAGRDIGLVVAATILVLIVIGGVLSGLKWHPRPKARD